MERRALNGDEIAALLDELQGWTVRDGKLHKVYRFGSFNEALGWMVRVGVYAEKVDHHPEWCNVYNRVTVNLVTHDLGNVISTWDAALARTMDAFAS